MNRTGASMKLSNGRDDLVTIHVSAVSSDTPPAPSLRILDICAEWVRSFPFSFFFSFKILCQPSTAIETRMRQLPTLTLLLYHTLYSILLIPQCVVSTAIVPIAVQDASNTTRTEVVQIATTPTNVGFAYPQQTLSTQTTLSEGPAEDPTPMSSIGSNSSSKNGTFMSPWVDKQGQSVPDNDGDDDDDKDINPINECAPNECRNQAMVCHEQSFRACQVTVRRRDACREKFARRCHLAFVQCEHRCLAASNPDPGDSRV
jgi:hypothetical protein